MSMFVGVLLQLPKECERHSAAVDEGGDTDSESHRDTAPSSAAVRARPRSALPRRAGRTVGRRWAEALKPICGAGTGWLRDWVQEVGVCGERVGWVEGPGVEGGIVQELMGKRCCAADQSGVEVNLGSDAPCSVSRPEQVG
jgi:hypothetical protein